MNTGARFKKVLKFVCPLVTHVWFDQFEKGFQQNNVGNIFEISLKKIDNMFCQFERIIHNLFFKVEWMLISEFLKSVLIKVSDIIRNLELGYF